MEKLEFNLGDTAYSMDCDYNYYTEQIVGLELEYDGTVTYHTQDFEFKKEDIGTLIFKRELDREMHLECMLGI